jgi:SAM-dependent MidA family methyltransferase
MTTHPPHDVVPAGWPLPEPEDIARHRTLVARIRDEISAGGGAIPFTRFMELALYAPALGYYSAPKPKFGEDGDFVTAPELTPLFGRCVANQVAQVLQAIDGGDVLEAGAGTGALAADVLRALETVNALPTRYLILEVSAALRALQHDTLQRRAPHLLSRVHWLDTLPEPGFRGVVLGNELLDAMPVARFCVNDESVAEQHVTYEAKGDGAHFTWATRPAGAALAARAAALDLPSGYCSEMASHADAWVRSLAVRLAQGAILLLDYGFPRAEFYHPQRAQGTLMCHYRHRTHADPLILAGLQDITAHVDFTAIAEAAHAAGLDVLGYTSQAAFLIGCGLTELAMEPMETRAHLERSQAINKLTGPHEMGELFKVIAFGRGLHGPLRGFVIQDRRSRL